MSTSISSRMLLPAPSTRTLLIKWVVALLVPVVVFTIWSGDAIVNNVVLGFISPASSNYATANLIEAAIFIVVFYLTIIALAGYLVAADSGRRRFLDLWLDVLIFALVPLILVISTGLILGLALSVVTWGIYIYVRNRIRKARHYVPPSPLASIGVLDEEQRTILLQRAVAGGFWFATAFAIVTLVIDLIYAFTGPYPS